MKPDVINLFCKLPKVYLLQWQSSFERIIFKISNCNAGIVFDKERSDLILLRRDNFILDFLRQMIVNLCNFEKLIGFGHKLQDFIKNSYYNL